MNKDTVLNKTEVILKFYFETGNSDFFIQQTFISESDDSNEILSELLDFCRKFQPFLIKKMSNAIQETHIHIESFYSNDELVEFYNNLLIQIGGEISYFDISCSNDVFDKLNDEQKENIEDAFDWIGNNFYNMN
jgi:hypothetical protein